MIGIFVIPKLPLIAMGAYEGAALRLDDLVVALFGAIALVFAAGSRETRISRVEMVVGAVVLASIASLLLNIYWERGSLLYVLRFVEYWLFFYAGILVKDQGGAVKALIIVYCAQAVAVVLQAIGVVGGYRDGIYYQELVLPTGLTGGSYEAPMMFALIAAFLLRAETVRTTWKHVFAVSTFFLVAISGARAPLIGFAAAYIIFLSTLVAGRKALGRIVLLSSLVGLFALAPAIHSLEFRDNSVGKRLQSVLTMESVHAVRHVYLVSPSGHTGITGQELARIQSDLRTGETLAMEVTRSLPAADASLAIRVNKWFWGLKTQLNQEWWHVLVGIGPGTMGNALDGGWLRIFIEQGILGLMAFALLLAFRPRPNGTDPLGLVLVVFVIGNLFIDYYLASRVMPLVFLMYGICAGAMNRRTYVGRQAGPALLIIPEFRAASPPDSR